jgi:hypothetical protein
MQNEAASIRAGTMTELKEPIGDWAFVDVGFARQGETCGLLFVESGRWNDDPALERLAFGSLVNRLRTLAERAGEPLNLVLEAPLSSAFGPSGNPAARCGERRGSQCRYWYSGPGPAVTIAALYILRALHASARSRELRLFEGFVSVKDRSVPSDHLADVVALRDVVASGGTKVGRFVAPSVLDGHGPGEVESTLGLLGLDPTPPPMIIVGAN